MAEKGSYFVLTLPLDTKPWQEAILNKRFEVNRKIYNALLQGGFKRYCQMAQTRKYRELIEKLDQTREAADRKKIYRELDEMAAAYRLTKAELSRDSTQYRQFFPENTDAPIVQNLSANAWKSLYSMMCRRSKTLHLKEEGQLNVLEGKSNKTSIRYADGKILWKKLEIPAVLKNSAYEQEALSREIRYCRLKQKEIRGKQRYFADIVLKGQCPVRKVIPAAHPGTVGVAVTLKQLYLVSRYEIRVEEFTRYSEALNVKRGELIRKMEVSRRLNNPQNYEENGRIRAGSLKWIYSKNYQKNRKRLREIARKQQAIRREERGKLIRSLLTMGDTFVVEQIDYRKLKERHFGKSVESSAAAGFLREMEWKCSVQGRTWKSIESGTLYKTWKDHEKERTEQPLLQESEENQAHTHPDSQPEAIWNTEPDACLHRAFLLMHADQESIDWQGYQRDWEDFVKLRQQFHGQAE